MSTFDHGARAGNRWKQFCRRLVLALSMSGLTACSSIEPWSVRCRIDALGDDARSATQTGRDREARDAWSEASQLARNAGLADREAESLLGLAAAEEHLGRYAESARHGEAALDAARRAGNRRLRNASLIQIALAQRRLGDYSAALRNLDEALSDGLEDSLRCAALRGRGAVADAMGDRSAALDAYDASLAAARTSGDRDCEAQTLNNLGGFFRATGEYGSASARYFDSLAIRTHQGDRLGQAKLLGNLCSLFYRMNRFDRAEPCCLESIGIARELGALGVEANGSNNYAALLMQRGDLDGADRAFRRSVAIKRDLGDRSGEARGLDNLGVIALRRGDAAAAEKSFSQSLALDESTGDVPGQAASHLNLAIATAELGDYATARFHFQEAMVLATRSGRSEISWRALDGMGKVAAVGGNRALAIYFGKRAVGVLQGMRADTAVLDGNTRRSFLDDKLGVYRRVAGWLIEQGRLLEAEQVMRLLKEEEYFHVTRGDGRQMSGTGQLSLSRGETDSAEEYDRLTRQLADIGTEYSKLDAKFALPGDQLSDDEMERHEKLGRQLETLRAALLRYLEDLDRHFRQVAATQPDRLKEFEQRQFERLKSIQGDLTTASRKIGEPATLIHYLVTDDDLRIIVTPPDRSIPSIHRRCAMTKDELNRRVASLRSNIALRRDTSNDATALHSCLIGPIQDVLRAFRTEVLIVYLDWVLRYLPMAALYDGSRYLVQDYSLAVYTAAAGDLTAEPGAEVLVAAMGVSAEIPGFSLLAAVAEELDAVVKEGDHDPRGVLPGSRYVDGQFTRKSLERVLKQRFEILHIATHFVFTPATASESYLLLGDGDRLTLDQLRLGDYQLDQVELLVLSACDTAVGDQHQTGLEVESLGSIAQTMGADAVLATLWAVNDASTASLMHRFHEYRKAGAHKAEALRKAQLSFLRGGGDPGADEARGAALADGDRVAPAAAEWSHPFYWAPFILMGNFL